MILVAFFLYFSSKLYFISTLSSLYMPELTFNPISVPRTYRGILWLHLGGIRFWRCIPLHRISFRGF